MKNKFPILLLIILIGCKVTNVTYKQQINGNSIIKKSNSIINDYLPPTLQIDNNGNLSFNNIDLNHYYVLQSTTDLLNWINIYSF